jgi:hypothetical protein
VSVIAILSLQLEGVVNLTFDICRIDGNSFANFVDIGLSLLRYYLLPFDGISHNFVNINVWCMCTGVTVLTFCVHVYQGVGWGSLVQV